MSAIIFEVTNGEEDAVLLVRTSENPEMKWITTERGLEACWMVRPGEPAHFVLRKCRRASAIS